MRKNGPAAVLPMPGKHLDKVGKMEENWMQKEHQMAFIVLACYLTTQSIPKIIQCQRYTHDKVWSVGAMILTGEDQSTRRKTCVMTTTSNTSPTQTGQQ